MSDPTEPTPRAVVLGMQEAADACSVSRDTIKRRRAAGQFPNAWKDDVGSWRIPVTDLLAAGLRPNAYRPEDGAPDLVVHRPESSTAAEVQELRARLEERERALASAERARAELVELLRAALERIPPALPPGAGQDVGQDAPAPVHAPPRRRWWSRSTDH